jgi:pre-mRNA-splicing factor CWC22
MSRTGTGVYMPPFMRARLEAEEAERQLQRQTVREENSVSDPPATVPAATAAAASDAEERAFQREYWDALRRSLMGIVNKTTAHNVAFTAREILRENVVRGRGLFCRAVLRAQNHSPELTPVLAALVSVVNSKVPMVGNLLVTRLVFQFKRCYKRHDIHGMSAAARFIAHLVAQRVQHELLLLKILATLLCNGTPSPDEIQAAANVFRDGFKYLEHANPTAFNFILEPIRDLVGRGTLDLTSECTLEGLLSLVRKWQDEKEATDIIPRGLDLVDPDEQTTHTVDLDDDVQVEQSLDNFEYDPNFEETEAAYDRLKEEILGPDDVEPELPPPPEPESASASTLDAPPAAASSPDAALSTEELTAQRKAVFLIFRSSIRAEEAAHKLLKQVPAGRESIVRSMLLEAACRERTFDATYASISELLCKSSARYQHQFETAFLELYATIDGVESKAIDIHARIYAHLLRQRAIHWDVLRVVRVTEQDTTASSRRFIRVLLQDMGEAMTVARLKEAFQSSEDAPHVAGFLPRDSLENARFALNFFEVISESGVDLRPIAGGLRRWYELNTAPNAAKRERDE